MNRSLGSAITSFFLLILVAALCLPNLIAAGKDESPATVPLGMESLLPRPHGQPFAIYASAEGMGLTRLQNVPAAANSLTDQQARRLAFFPSPLSFRVTATTLGLSATDEEQAAKFDSGVGTEELLAALQFRLRVYRGGLRTDRLEPADVHMIGVPADVPYGERIYRVTFNSEPLPATDRLVLEVSAPSGELLCKFPVPSN